MKKIISTMILVLLPFIVSAQDAGAQPIDKEIFRICATIFTVGLFMVFILVVMRRAMDYRLKNKFIEIGIPENMVTSILQTNPKEDINSNVKWFAILFGTGVGLTVIYYTLPIGIHSLAIMSFSIAASFLGYYFFVKQQQK